MLENTQKLKETFIQDLELQKQNLYNAFVFQGLNPGKNEGMKTLIPKVKEIEGSKLNIPAIKFYSPSGSAHRLTQAQFDNLKNTLNFNTLKDLSYFLYNQTSLTNIDLSDLYIKTGTEVQYMLYGTSAPVKFSSINDLTGITDISGAFYRTGSNRLDLSSFILDETQPIIAYKAFGNAIKLPRNYSKCTFVPRGLFAGAAMKNTGLLDTSKLKFDTGGLSGVNVLAEMFNSGTFDDIIFDLSFSNIANFNSTAITSTSATSGGFSCGSSNSFTFINKEQCPLNMFAGVFGALKTSSDLDLTGLNVNGATNFKYAFYNTTAPKLILKDVDFSKVTDANNMFYYSNIPELELHNCDFSKVTNFNNFAAASFKKITHDTGIDMSSATKISNVLPTSSVLEEVCPLLNLGKAYTQKSANYSNYTLSLSYHSKLSRDNIVSIFNNLYDLNVIYDVANGGKLYSQKVTLNSTAKANLSADDIAIATSKGWTVS